jgi:hypothetical protein
MNITNLCLRKSRICSTIDQSPNPYIVQVDAGCFPGGFTTTGHVFKGSSGANAIILFATKKEMMTIVPALSEALVSN